MKLHFTLAVAFTTRTVLAEPAELDTTRDDTREQAVSASIGFAGGGGWTPGGLHLDAAYLLRLDARDWFDIGLGMTLGGGGAACFADPNGYTCNHGIAQGRSINFAAGVRHYLDDRW